MSRPNSLSAISSTASWTRRSLSKSHSGPSNSRLSSPAMELEWAILALCAMLGEKLVEDGEYLGRIGDAPHREILMLLGDARIGAPQVGRGRGEAVAQGRLRAHLDIGEILGERQDLLAQQLAAAIAVLGVVVAVGRLRRVDVPVVGAVALAHHAHHLLERGRDDGAAGLAAVEERFFVNLLRVRGMTD